MKMLIHAVAISIFILCYILIYINSIISLIMSVDLSCGAIQHLIIVFINIPIPFLYKVNKKKEVIVLLTINILLCFSILGVIEPKSPIYYYLYASAILYIFSLLQFLFHVLFLETEFKIHNPVRTLNTEVCSICLSEDDIDKHSTVCNHIFHKKCIEEWINKYQNNECPTCRTILYQRH